MNDNNETNQQQQEQQRIADLLNEMLFLQREREALLTENINTLASRVAWSELCFKRVEDSGLIHMSEVIKKMVKDLEMLKVSHNKLSIFVKNHLQPPNEGSSGGDSDLPLSTQLQKSMNRLGR